MEKFNATLAKTQKGDKKLTEKRKALFVIYFVGFYLYLTKNEQKIVEKTVCLWTLQNQFLPLLLARPTNNLFA